MSQDALSQGSQRPSPFLMIPIRRCGSHALRLRLNMNDDFYAPYPLHIVDFMPLLPLYGDLNNDDNYFQLIVDVIGLQNVSMVKWDGVVFDPVKVFDAVKDKPRSIHVVIWELLFQTAEAHGARAVMDKSLDSVHYADELIELIDGIKFLNVVRDPRAQINSINQAIIHEFDPLLNTQLFMEAHKAARALIEDYPERVLTIRFEDFISNQAAVLCKVCEFMGIAFSEKMLDVEHSQEAMDIAGMSALWESNASSPIKANVDKFKSTMSMETIELIETMSGDYMDLYGYERMTDGKAKIPPERWMDAWQHNAARKEMAWKELRLAKPQDYQLRRFRADTLEMIKQRMIREQEHMAMQDVANV